MSQNGRKTTHFVVPFLNQYLPFFEKKSPLHISPFQKCIGIIFSYVDYWMSNIKNRFVSIFWFDYNPKIIYIFVELSF